MKYFWLILLIIIVLSSSCEEEEKNVTSAAIDHPTAEGTGASIIDKEAVIADPTAGKKDMYDVSKEKEDEEDQEKDDGDEDHDDDDEEEEDEEEDEDTDHNYDHDDGDDDDDEEEDEEEEEEEEEKLGRFAGFRRQPHRPTSASHLSTWRHRAFHRFVSRKMKNATAGAAASAASGNITTTTLTPAGRFLNATRSLNLSKKQVVGIGVRLLILGGIGCSLRHIISFKGVMQTLMLMSVLIEIAGRLGLLNNIRMPMSRYGMSKASPPTFTFEILNERYTSDHMRLNLVTGDLNRKSNLQPEMIDLVRTVAYGSSSQAPVPPAASSPSSANETVAASSDSPTANNATTIPSRVIGLGLGGLSLGRVVLSQQQQHQLQQAAQQILEKPRCYIASIKGDMMLSQGPYLAQLVSFLLSTATTQDEIVLMVESGGGAAHEYGLGASQLERFRRKGIKLTVCVDKVAASGGYMMACVADKLVAAPFAMIGSIGATTSVPVLNIEKLLKNWGITAYTVRSGKHKGSTSPFLVGDAKKDQEALEKLQGDLAKVHELFKSHVAKHRKMVDIDLVGTGEVWQGSEAKALGLVDDIMTSEEYMSSRLLTHQVIRVGPVPEKPRWLTGSRPPGLSFSSAASSLSPLSTLARRLKLAGGGRGGGLGEGGQFQLSPDNVRQVASLVLEGLWGSNNQIFCRM